MESNGILSKGYGIVPKLVTLEGSLSIDAKALYTYFCAYAGNGFSCYPPRSKILNDLGFSPATYYTYLRELQEGGYIDVKKHKTSRQEWCNNRIILLQNPPILAKAEEKRRRRFDITGGLRDFGYGRIPLAVMTDRRISRKAKALYAYFCAFASSKSVCTPQIEFTLSFLNICVNSYYKYLNELLCFHYITVFHRKNEYGRYISNSIMLNPQPDHVEGMRQLEERRERFAERLKGREMKLPKRRRKRRPTVQNPRQLTEAIRRQIGFDELVKSRPEGLVNVIVGFITELSFDPYKPVETADIDYKCVEGFLAHMERSINPVANIRNHVSYFKRAFINFLINLQMQSDGKTTC
ncbi:MAG: Phage replication initiation protein [Oscillospiraceae bacterium]|nr:Phage replication initiation protein [Oscillospiraceae bacterium]